VWWLIISSLQQCIDAPSLVANAWGPDVPPHVLSHHGSSCIDDSDTIVSRWCSKGSLRRMQHCVALPISPAHVVHGVEGWTVFHLPSTPLDNWKPPDSYPRPRLSMGANTHYDSNTSTHLHWTVSALPPVQLVRCLWPNGTIVSFASFVCGGGGGGVLFDCQDASAPNNRVNMYLLPTTKNICICSQQPRISVKGHVT
jgi:hypothetical protein